MAQFSVKKGHNDNFWDMFTFLIFKFIYIFILLFFKTRSSGRYAPLLLAPAEGWGPFGWKEDLDIDLDIVEIFGVYLCGGALVIFGFSSTEGGQGCSAWQQRSSLTNLAIINQ